MIFCKWCNVAAHGFFTRGTVQTWKTLAPDQSGIDEFKKGEV